MIERTWPTAVGVGLTLIWLAGLGAAVWYGLNHSADWPPIAWFVAYPLYFLFPGLAAFAAVRVRTEDTVVVIASAVPAFTVLVALITESEEADVIRATVTSMLLATAAFIAIYIGARLMRRGGLGRTLVGFVVAGLVFVGGSVVAYLPQLVATA